MKKDDAGFLDFFEEEPIVESGETVEETHPDMPSPADTTEEEEKDAGAKTLDDGRSEPEEEEEPKEEEKPTEDDETELKRYEHWQSKHDKLAEEHKALKAQQEVNKDYLPIAEYLYQNPQALLKLQEQLGESAPQDDAPRMPTAPEKPERPANYSRYEAVQDPESASAKYEEALMDYNSNMLDYMNEKQLYNEQQQYAEMQKVAEQEKAARQQEAFKNSLITNGLKADEFPSFMETMNGEASIDPKNLITYYRILAGDGVTKAQLQAEEFKKQKARIQNTPKAVGSEGGETTVTPSDDEAFNTDMLNWKR